MAAYPGPREPSSSDRQTVPLWWLVPLGLVIAFFAVGFITVSSLSGAGEPSAGARAASAAATRKLPAHWTVKPGDTYSNIALKTGLSTDQLEEFNPLTDPTTIVPGQRIKLRLHVPKPKRKPLGPRYWTVRAGQSFGSIAAKSRVPITTIERLNPKLKPEALRIGDRVRLRR